MSSFQKQKLFRKLLVITLLPTFLILLLAVYFGTRSSEQLASQQLTIVVFAGLATLAYLIFAWLSIRKLTTRIDFVRQSSSNLLDGKLLENIHVNGQDEITAIASSLDMLGSDLKNKSAFADQLKNGNLEASYNPLHADDHLGNSLLSIKENLLSVKEEDRKRNWTTDALARFVEVLRSDKKLRDLCHDITKNMVQLLHANQGAIFIIQQENSGKAVLEMQACYAFSRTKHFSKTVVPGEGLIGQTFLEKQTVYLKEVPENFIRITSGLGDANPKHILIVPLKMGDDVVGIVELASFQPFEKYEIAFVEKIGESVAHNILSFQTTESTRRLLEESQQQAEHMRAQEEELRQNQEELQATQEEISRKYNELFRQLTELNYQSRFDQLKSITSTKRRNIEYYFDIIRNQIITFAENKMVIDAAKEFTGSFHKISTTYPDEVWNKMRESVSRYYRDEFIPRLQDNIDQAESIDYFIPANETALVLQYHYISNNPNPTGEKSSLNEARDGSAYSRVHAQYHPVMRSFLEKFGYYDIFLIDHNTGHIVYSVFKEVDYATSLLSDIYSNTNFARVVKEAIDSSNKKFVRLIDFEPYAPSYQAPASFIACPIFDGDEKVGILVFQMPINKINQILTGDNKWKADGLGQTGETFLVGSDFKLRSVARELVEDKAHYLTMLKDSGYHEMAIRQVDKMNTSILVERIKIDAVTRALEGKSGTAIEKNTYGDEALVAYSPLSIPDVQWVVLSTMREEEASQRINELRNR
ncbi:MAG TPA: GAF domain-containing protein [Ohtaekwangia sp.]